MPAPATPSAAARGLAQQGYYELSGAELARLDLALRFTPTVMLVAAIVGLATRQEALHGALAAIGVLTFLLPAHHPLDLVWNLGVRWLFGAPELPANPLPRRLGMLVAAALNLAVCVAFARGNDAVAYGFGALLVATQAVLAVGHRCVVSWTLDRLARARHRPQRLLSGDEARRLVAAGALLVDVRSPREYANGHLPGALNVPVDEIERRAGELIERHQPLVLYCAAGVRCHKAAVYLEQAGAEVHQLGTLARWSEPA